MTNSDDEKQSSKWSEIETDREQRPTCTWCGTNSSENWKYVIATGKFYCSDGCFAAAYNRFFLFVWGVSIVGLPLSLIAYFSLDIENYKGAALYLFCLLLVCAIGGLAYFIESKKTQPQVSKGSKRMQGSTIG
jgi:hypothetical protein